LKPKRIWTWRHYRVPLVGSLSSLFYANFVYHGLAPILARTADFIVEPWMIALTAQGAMWLGVWCARRMWFD
jgi:hypothetical protein